MVNPIIEANAEHVYGEYVNQDGWQPDIKRNLAVINADIAVHIQKFLMYFM